MATGAAAGPNDALMNIPVFRPEPSTIVTFDLQPTLTGTFLELRPLRAEDFDALFAAASDPLVWEQHPEADRHKPDVFRRYFEGAMESRGAFAIVERKTGTIIGSSRYWAYDADRSEIEIGWTFLERAYWGGSYNRELKTLMLDHAFQFVDRVLFRVGENNLRSQRGLLKIGARLLRTEPRPSPGALDPNTLVFAIERPGT